jgi:hypothetical protein
MPLCKQPACQASSPHISKLRMIVQECMVLHCVVRDSHGHCDMKQVVILHVHVRQCP